MPIELNRKNGIPIYLQLKEQIKRLIETGQWEAGRKIPTEREMAEVLNISRNTVSTAYKELEGEGILLSSQGRGTFVADSDAVLRQEGRKERLLRLIDVAMEEATELGFTIDEFEAIIHARVREKKDFLSRVKVAFVECNREQLDYFCRELHLGPGVALIPVLLDDFRRNPAKTNQFLAGVDMVVSTFFHLQEVKELIADKKKTILGIALNPQLETIVRIARFARGSKLAIICLSDTFVTKIKNCLWQAGITHLEFAPTISKAEEDLKQTLTGAEAVIVSQNRRKEIEALTGGEIEVVEFRFLPDMGSVNVIKTALLELKEK